MNVPTLQHAPLLLPEARFPLTVLASFLLTLAPAPAAVASADDAPPAVGQKLKPPNEAQTSQPAAQPKPLDVPVEIRLPVPPAPFKANGKQHLVYELHVTNFSTNECTITRVEALNAETRQPLAQHEGDDLAKCLARPGVTITKATEKPKLAGGLRAVVYMWLTLEPGAQVPPSLVHRLTFLLGGLSEEMTVECARAVLGKEPLVLGPPLRGGGWLAANGPSNSSGHRRALIPFGGGVHIAQRFAIDWVQLRDEGRTYTGDAKDNKNYRCYGAEALAAIEGVVVAVKDGVPENVPGLKSRAVPMTRDTMAGNYVVLDVGEGRYAYYAHFQPGQIRVKLGDKVSRGQVLGLVGNSGNSTEPHLHFQISDTDSLFTSEGLPYHFRSFEVLGKGWDWKSKGTNGESDKRQEELPLELQVVRFPTSSD